MRAAHQVLDDAPKILRDPVAVGLTEGTAAIEIERRSAELLTPACKLLRSAIVLRSRFAEDALAAAIASGVEQYVLLGAGLDTFGFRQSKAAAKLRIFEIDYPATQRWKLERLLSLGMKSPSNVTYVPLDLELHGLEQPLRDAGFDLRRPAFFSWLGVTQYLDDQTIDSTLTSIARLTQRSGVTLSFNPPDQALDGLDREEALAGAERAAAVAEPWRARPTAASLIDRLRTLGFARVEHLQPKRADALYFQGRKDGLRAPRFEQLISAFT